MNYEELLQEWKHRLGLDEWRIALKPECKANTFDDNGQGVTDFEESTKMACIYIRDPKTYVGKELVEPFDWEQVLVHELLHLKTSLLTFGVSELQERVGHQIIDDLARAFVDAKRIGRQGGAKMDEVDNG